MWRRNVKDYFTKPHAACQHQHLESVNEIFKTASILVDLQPKCEEAEILLIQL